MAEIVCKDKTTREINHAIRRLAGEGTQQIRLTSPGARHNLGVAVLDATHLTVDGSVGYYCAGMMDGPTVEIKGSAGWGLAESMMSGTVIVHGNAGNGAGAAIRSGTIVIHGDAAARLGVSMKGGQILVAGNCGYMAGFMGQKGTIIVCGDTGAAFADSMYETVCFVGGKIGELGNDTVIEEPSEGERSSLSATLSRHLSETIPNPDALHFKKVVSGRKLWNFDKHERALWREAL